MLKKNSALIPLTLDYNGSSCQELPNRSLSSSPEPEELDPTAAVASSKPSPGKLARRGSKGQRLYSDVPPPACRCGSPSPPPGRVTSSGSGSSLSGGLSSGGSGGGNGASIALVPSASAAALQDSVPMAATAAAAQSAAAAEGAMLDVAAGAEVAVAVDGHRALATMGPAGLRWSYDISKCCVPGVRSESVPFEEILAAEVLPPRRGMVWVTRPTKMYRLCVYTFRRGQQNPCSWHPRQIVIESASEEVVQQWGRAINTALGQQPRRPRHLLVFINPFGGSKQARALYQSVVRPVFSKAGIKATVVETQRGGHAAQQLREMALGVVEGLCGVVAVGGDGLFHEVINGLLALRSGSDERARAARAMRVGHIPAGSTDAVACSLNGTRSAFTAAVHIALGDSTPLDVLRIDTADGHFDFATCMASYGFMGDLMAESERYRWLGPRRYDIIGAKMLAHNRAYSLRVAYLPPYAGHHLGRGVSMVCHSGCQLCMMDHTSSHEAVTGVPDFREGSQHSLARRGSEWKFVEGEFAGVMLVIMPCRSDKSAAGVAKYGHLCDGAVHLVLVRRCSRWQYLKFLLTMSNKGLEAGKLGGYIEVVPAVAVKVEPVGKESRWNVDGELLPSNHITAEVHRGLVDVFARGVER